MTKGSLLASVFGASAVLGGMLCPQPGFAQSTQAAGTDQPHVASDGPAAPQGTPASEIVVTGIRHSLSSAANIKRTAGSIVDAISAEDMGAFPDQNIAESLQRVTGVQIQRDRGEGRDISIRGLDPKFSHITLNGDGLISIAPITNLNPNGAPAPGRSFDFTTLNSDFVQTLVVSKTSTADQEEGGLAGSVDVVTLKPLDMKKRKLTLNIEQYYNSYAKKSAPHVTAAYADKFFDDTVGVVVGFDYSNRYMETQSYQSSGQDSRTENQLKGQGAATLYTNTGALGNGPNSSFVDWNGDGDNLDSYRFNHLVQFEDDTGTRVRKAANLGLQWRPSSRLEVNFNGIYSDYKTDFINAAYSFQDHLGGDPTLTGNRVVADHISSIQPFSGDVSTTAQAVCSTVGVTPAKCTIPSSTAFTPVSGLIDYYDLRGALVDNITKFNYSHTKTAQGQIGAVYRLSENLKLDVQGSYDRSKRNSILNAGQDAFSYKEVIYDQRSDISGIPTAGYGAGADPLNPSTYSSGGSFFTGFIVPQKVTQKMGSTNLTWHDTPLSWLTQVKVGYKYSDMGLNQAVSNLSVTAANFATLSGETLTSSAAANGLKGNGITMTNYMTTYGGSNFLSAYNGASTFPRTWVGPNISALLDKYPLSMLESLPGAVVAQPAQTYRIKETTNAAYIRADFAFLNDALTGNIGVRMVHTRSYAGGFTGDPATLYQNNVSTLAYRDAAAYTVAVRNYWSVLPSVNLRYNIDQNKILRFAVSQTVTRPDFGNMIPNNGAISLVSQTQTLANPNLKPYYSVNFDLGGEWYFGKEGMFSIDFFRKDIRGYYVSSFGSATYTYTSLPALGGTPVSLTVQTTLPVNGSSTRTQGFEVSYQQPFTFLPGFLSGFGTLLNYTFTDAGTIKTSATGASFPLPYVSKHAANAVLYYEKHGISARAAYVWRSKYVEVAGGVGGDSRGGSYVKAAGYLDLSSKYQITPQFAITLDCTNVLNTAVERVDIYGFGRGYEVNGRTIAGGVRMSL